MNVFTQVREAQERQNIRDNARKDLKTSIGITLGWEIGNIWLLCKTSNEKRIFNKFVKLLEKIEQL